MAQYPRCVLYLDATSLSPALQLNPVNSRCEEKTDAVLCGPQENVLGQKFAVDVTIWADLTASCKSDDLSDTLDYRDTYR
jgi:Dihydroneopterin aldolase